MKLLNVFLLIFVLSFPVFAEDCKRPCRTIYIGADAQMRKMGFNETFGENLFKHYVSQGNFYAGIKIKDAFGVQFMHKVHGVGVGLEGGYEKALTKSLTQVQNTISTSHIMSEGRIQGAHLSLMTFMPITEKENVHVFCGAGILVAKSFFEHRALSVSEVPVKNVNNGDPKTQVISTSDSKTLRHRKAILRLNIGLEYMLNSNLWFRGTIGWVNTAKMTIPYGPRTRFSVIPEIKPKDTTVCGIGIVWNF